MSATGSEPPKSPPAGAPGGAPPKAPEVEGYERPTYEGSRVPWYLVLLFVGFIVFSLYYFIRWVPESLSEWFSIGGK